jgi:hypothetical protein
MLATITDPIVSVVAIIVLFFAATAILTMLEDRIITKGFVYVIFGAACLYFVVRFIRWAWETPTPFVNQ